MVKKKNQSIYNEYGKAEPIYTARKGGGLPPKVQRMIDEMETNYKRLLEDKNT